MLRGRAKSTNAQRRFQHATLTLALSCLVLRLQVAKSFRKWKACCRESAKDRLLRLRKDRQQAAYARGSPVLAQPRGHPLPLHPECRVARSALILAQSLLKKLALGVQTLPMCLTGRWRA
jgi:hypothetical protein